MAQTDTLIHTKLRLPFTRTGLVPRARLQQQIARGLRGPFTLIAAPAGFGKTTLVATSVADCGLPVAWLTLDKNDNQAGQFLGYLVAAVRQADPASGTEATRLLATGEAPPEAVLTSLCNDLAATAREMVLVLDDYQFISSQAVHASVAFLLEHCPSTLHLLIATRSDPPLPLARLRARGQMLELRSADLRFTDGEAAQFLNDVMGLDLDRRWIAVLEERTEGWIAGLQMAALSLEGRDANRVERFVQGFAGTNRFIMDFMLEEVLARQPEEIQAFLLQTSILTRLSGPLCDAVTGTQNSQAMLERLEQRNLFVVPLDDHRRWYRYHHLFADLLQARLAQSGAERSAPLFSRATQWCERNGQISEAVSYALAAPDYARAAELVERYRQQMMGKGQIATVWSWLRALPETVVNSSAPLSLTAGWLLWLRGQIDPIGVHLANAERALDPGLGSEEPDEDRAYLLAELATLRAFFARYTNDLGTATSLAEHALTLVPEDSPSQEDAQLRTMIFLALATAYDGAGDLERAVEAYAETIRQSRLGASAAGVTGITYRMIGVQQLLGHLHAAEAACRDALSYIEAQGMARLPAAGILHVALSEVLVERNELEAAEEHLLQGMELGQWGGRLDAIRNAAYTLSRLRQARQDLDGALAAVQEAESALGEPPSSLARAELLALKARILVRQGAVTEAAHCMEQAIDLAGWDRGLTGERITTAANRVRLAQAPAHESVAQLTPALVAAEARGRMRSILELYILRSLAHVEQGQTQGAEADLERALALAQPEGYVRIFVDEGQPMRQLIEQWLPHAAAGPLQDYAHHLRSQFHAASQKTPPLSADFSPSLAMALIEPLSQRELEVLGLIAQGKTNQEIADQLIIARGTVKAHTSSIYRKLDVANRTEAAARARQYGLLS